MRRIIAIIALVLSFGLYSSANTQVSDDIRRVQFDHKSKNIHMNVNFKKLVSMERMMPRSLKEEIANDYYPYLRKNLVDKDYLEYKKAKISVTRYPNDLLDLKMEFPHYFLNFKNVKWEDLDNLYHVHFEE